jgi:hypothetical protein
MQTEIRPYCTTGKGQHDKVKSNFVRMFVEQFFSSLEDDEDYQRVSEISDKLNTKSRDFLLKALRTSMSFDFINRQSNRYQVILKIKLNKIKDELASGMDNAVMAEARRKPDGSNHLRLVSEMNELSGDLAWSFLLNTDTNTVSFVKPVNAHRRDRIKRLPQLVMENLNKLQAHTESEREEFRNDKQ